MQVNPGQINPMSFPVGEHGQRAPQRTGRRPATIDELVDSRHGRPPLGQVDVLNVDDAVVDQRDQLLPEEPRKLVAQVA